MHFVVLGFVGLGFVVLGRASQPANQWRWGELSSMQNRVVPPSSNTHQPQPGRQAVDRRLPRHVTVAQVLCNAAGGRLCRVQVQHQLHLPHLFGVL